MVDELKAYIEGNDFVFQQILDRTESETRFLLKDLGHAITCFETIQPLLPLALDKDQAAGVRVRVDIGDIRVQISPEKPAPGIYIIYKPDTPECYHIGFSYPTTISQILEKLKALKQPAQA